MVTIKLECPSCHGNDVGLQGKKYGKQFYFCNNNKCASVIFRLDYVCETQNLIDITESSDNCFDEPKENTQKKFQPECPSCYGEDVRKFGIRQGKQIYKCNNSQCARSTFRLEYDYKACDPQVKARIFDLTQKGKSARAIGRILSVSKDTVVNILKTQTKGH